MFDVTRDGEVVALEEDKEHDQEQEQELDQEQNESDDNEDPIEIVDDESKEDGDGGAESGGAGTTTAVTTQAPRTATASGRTVKAPSWMDDYELGMTAAEINYYKAMKALTNDFGEEMGLIGVSLNKNKACLVGTGLGEGISNTNELKVMGFDEAMKQPDRDAW